MRYRARVSVNYDVQVTIGGISLVLLSLFGNGRSVNDLLIGGGGEWGPGADLEPWLEQESNPIGSLLGGVGVWGEKVDSVEW